jgi:hypothetical protein
MEEGRIISQGEFTDRATRPVFEDEQGQYVYGDDGVPVRKVWLLADEPTVWRGSNTAAAQ